LSTDASLNVVFEIFFVMFLVLMNAFFVAAEFALVKIRPSRVNQLVNEGVLRAKLVKSVISNMDPYLSSCQLGITIASVSLGWRGGSYVKALTTFFLENFTTYNLSPFYLQLLSYSVSFGTIFGLIVIIHMVIGELSPKTLAIQKTELFALWLTPPLFLFHRITYPLIWIVNNLSTFLLKILRIPNEGGYDQAHTEEEIRLLVNESEKKGIIDQEERVLFDNVFQFSDRVAREAMLPRTEMTVLYTEDSFDEIQEAIIETKHTRYPVAEDDKDNIIGFIHISDFYAESMKQENRSVQNILRQILTIPEFMELSHALKLMKKNRTHIAVVLDEYGGTAGLITLEDIIEELVGEIQDEFDNDRPILEEIENGYSIDGRMLIQDLNNMLTTDLSNDDVDTIGGWVQMMLESELDIGKIVTHRNITFEIREIVKNIIVRINVQINSDHQAEEE
jgi:CBS domain containing-hemolysin-like protein